MSIPKPSLFLIVAYTPRSAEHGNTARSRLYYVGYVTAYPTECKRALRARYALANSNLSVPPSVSRALKRIPSVFVFSDLYRSAPQP